jgi:hypothetical protein
MKQTHGWKPVVAAALAWICGLGVAARAGELEGKGRELLAASQDALLGVSAVMRIEAGSERQEVPMELMGTVIHESGLVVISDRSLNPARGQIVRGTPLRSSVSKILLRYADGTEVPARQVYSDADLDLSFLLPRPRPGQTLPALKPVVLDAAAKADLLDPVFAVGRMPKALNWEPRIVLTRVNTIARRPRTMYFLDAQTGPGFPVFTADGVCLGLIAQRSLTAQRAGGQMPTQAVPAVVPCEDILDLLPAALAAAEKAREEPDEEEEDEENGADEAAAPAEREPEPAPAE